MGWWQSEERVRGVARGLADQEEEEEEVEAMPWKGERDMTGMTKKKGEERERRFRRNAMMIALSLCGCETSSSRLCWGFNM